MMTVSASPASAWRVVIIDDNPEDRGELRRLLLRGSERRYVFIEAETGMAGLEAVRAAGALPDCVLLDFNLPDMTALEVLAGLAGPDGLPICPAVVLTGGAGPEVGRQVLLAGAQDYIVKDRLTAPALTRIVENARERLPMVRELQHRNIALRQSEKTLSEADRRKDEFLATLAHELRNPLAPVRAGLQVLRLAKDSEVRQQVLDMMERQLAQMTRLIDDLLDISRITSGKMLLRPERVLVKGLVDAAVEAARPGISAGHHILNIDLPEQALWLNVDPPRLAQVIGNLLNNSAKYSGDGGAITLAVRKEGDEVVIQITDTGFGIPQNMLTQIFEMFTQVNRTLEHALGGLGIGLALVKQLVEMHGGSVYAESAGTGRGSAFTIRLPIAAPAPFFETPAIMAPLAVANSLRILVVDDNADAATTLAMLLSLSGHETRTAFNGPDAVDAGMAFHPEVVFLDIGLPGMDGHEVARRFRAIPALKDALLIAVTGWGSEDDRLRSREAGFDLHLTKPVTPAAFDVILAQFQADRGAPPQSAAIQLSRPPVF